MATCAICLGPITAGEKFRLVETEVVHKRCALSAAGSTALQRAQHELALAREQIATAASQIAERDATIENNRRKAKRGRDDRHQELRDQIIVLHRRLQTQADTIAARDRQIAALQIQIAERDRAVTTAEPPVNHDDGKDPTEVRYSLLEFS